MVWHGMSYITVERLAIDGWAIHDNIVYASASAVPRNQMIREEKTDNVMLAGEMCVCVCVCVGDIRIRARALFSYCVPAW